MLAGSSGVGPKIELGAGFQEALPGSIAARQDQAQAMQHIYADQEYWLVWRGGKGQAVLLEDFQAKDVLKILWQVIHDQHDFSPEYA